MRQLSLARAPGAAHPPGLPYAAPGAPDGAFWRPEIKAGAGLIVDLTVHLDLLSPSIARIPEAHAASRPALIHYLAMLKTLASAWSGMTRPALHTALGGLAQAGASLAEPLTAALLAGLRRRLGAPVQALGALLAEADTMLGAMACVTRDLHADTLLVHDRLQSDQVHTLLLAQQASTLQSKLDDAKLRQDAYWLQGPHCEHIRQEIALHGSALGGVRRQLDHLHAEQAAMRAEAHYLQQLMPSLTAYLGALDRLAEAVRTILAGARAVQGELQQLAQALAADAALAPGAQARLRAALPQWRALPRLRPPPAARTPGGRRP